LVHNHAKLLFRFLFSNINSNFENTVAKTTF
jgi:hypothetical protein